MSAEREETGDVRPTVSVIMVCYNGSALLPESLASLKAQSFEDWELVFWDNGSHDGSADLARAFDTRTRVLGGSERLTLGAARGKALQAARGDLIAFLDHDDLWRADKLERQVEIMTRREIGLCYSDCEVIDAEGTELGRYARRVKPHEGRVLHPLLVENFIPTVTVMISREAYEAAGPFDPTLNMPADYEQWLRMARGSEVVFVGEALGSYRLSRGSLTSDLDQAYRPVDALYERLAARSSDGVESRWISRGWACHYWRWAIRGLLERGRPGESLRRFVAGCRAAGGPVLAVVDFGRFALGLVHGVAVRAEMIRARRDA